jgi:hypothetical protein
MTLQDTIPLFFSPRGKVAKMENTWNSVPVKEDDDSQRNEKPQPLSISVSQTQLTGDADPSNNDEKGKRDGDCCGLNSSDSQIKQSSRLKFCFGCLTFLLAILLIIFLVIIPEVTQNMVDDSDLIIYEVNIINPNDISFESHVTQKFKDVSDGTHATIQMHKLSLTWNDNTGNGKKKLASLTHSNEMDITTSKVTLKSQAEVKDLEALSEFNLFAITANEFNWMIHGTATVTTSGLVIPVDIEKTLKMTGFNNFPIPPLINQINVTDGTPTVITNEIQATFTNVANIAISFGQTVEFILKSHEIIIGKGMIPNLDLKIGPFDVNATLFLSANPNTTQYDQLMKVISNFTTGLSSPVTLEQFSASTPSIQWLEAGLASMNLQSSIPGVTDELIMTVDMYPDGTLVIPFQMMMKNAIDTIFRLTHLKATIYSNDIAIATVNTDVNITLSPRATLLSPLIDSHVIYTATALQELGRLETVGSGLLDVRSSTITGAINEFRTVSSYSQDDIPATVHHA